MKIVIDMNLSPDWVREFEFAGIEAVHWSQTGPANAPDADIMKWAQDHDRIVFTHDLDFGTILHLTGARRPSVIQLRSEDVRPGTMGHIVCNAVSLAAIDLKQGALVTIDPRKNRISLLPLKRA